MPICLSHGGPTMYGGDSRADEILIGTVGGVFNLQRKNDSKWEVAWKSLEANHVSSIQFEPQSKMAFAGVYRGGVFASADGGRNWQPRSGGLSTNDVYSLSCAYSGSKATLYAGTEPAHLFKSVDMGESWAEISSLREAPSVDQWTFPAPPHTAHVKFIAVDPHNFQTIYAAIEVGGLLKSRDGGLTWEEQHGFYEDVHRIVICPSDSEKVYISTGAGVYHSVDGGRNWKQLTTHSMRIGYPDAMVVVPGRENIMFVAGARNTPGAWRKTHTADSRIARSRDSGKNWEALADGLPEHMRGNVEAISLMSWGDSFELFAGTTDGDIFYSDDEGDHWSKIMAGLPPISKFHHYRGLR